jgi:hypothetical protein
MKPTLLSSHPDRRPHARRHRRRGAGATPPIAHTDAAVQRVREAGGPVDRASYSCHCGCLFQETVSTTVMCPHCGAGQAW